MLVIRTLSLGLMVLVIIMLGIPAHAQKIDDTTKDQLRQLKEICDDGLVSPEVCKEKQRNILGLQGSTGMLRKSLQHLQIQPPVVVQPHGAVSEGIESTAPHAHRLSVRLPSGSGWRQFATEELIAAREALLRRFGGDPKAEGLLKLLEASTASAANAHFRNDGDILQIGRFSPSLVLDQAHAEKTCQTLAEQVAAVAQASGRPGASLLDCGIRQIAGFQTLYVEKNMIRDKVRVIQLWVVKSPEETFHFFLRCKADRITTRKKELEDIVANIQWQ